VALRNRCRHFDALLLIHVFSGTKCCPSVFKTVGLRFPTPNIRNFNFFTCSSSRCHSDVFSTANADCRLTVIFRKSCLIHFSMFLLFVLSCVCLISALVYIRADSVIGHWLLSSVRINK
jgi:hypothetical protein